MKNILTEGSATTSHFVVLGTVKGGSWDDSYAAVHLDFSRIWERECRSDEDEQKSDFEKWSLFNGTCHLGKKVLIQAI